MECEVLMEYLVWEAQQESKYTRDWSQAGALDLALIGMPVVIKVII